MQKTPVRAFFSCAEDQEQNLLALLRSKNPRFSALEDSLLSCTGKLEFFRPFSSSILSESKSKTRAEARIFDFCAEGQDRTGDLSLFRRALYQLSYLGSVTLA